MDPHMTTRSPDTRTRAETITEKLGAAFAHVVTEPRPVGGTHLRKYS